MPLTPYMSPPAPYPPPLCYGCCVLPLSLSPITCLPVVCSIAVYFAVRGGRGAATATRDGNFLTLLLLVLGSKNCPYRGLEVEIVCFFSVGYVVWGIRVRGTPGCLTSSALRVVLG